MATTTRKSAATSHTTTRLRGHHRRAGVMRIATWGNCMAVRIPREKARENGLALGDEVIVQGMGDGVLIRPARRGPSLRELVAGIPLRKATYLTMQLFFFC